MDVKESIERIQQYIDERHGGNIYAAAKAIGINKQTLWNWIKEKRKNPRAESLNRVMEKISELTGEKAQPRVFNVPIVGVSGAGIPDSEVYTDDEVEYVTVPHDMYCEGCFAVRVEGDSMEPTIARGAICGILPTHSFSEGGIFLVTIPYLGQVLKRFALKNGIPTLKSDNHRYDDIIIEEEYRTAELIRGRVIWVLHKM
ncbi:MAG: hypothetical protein IJU76_15155 [Desulfovibrionaceae bacterium]|nr:hypothetical protein [Desulfovibrionaceae bacterium]